MLSVRDSSFEEDGKLSHDLAPVLHASLPLPFVPLECEIEDLEDRFVGREMPSVLEQLAQAGIQRLNGIGGVDDLPNGLREVEEWSDPFPIGFP